MMGWMKEELREALSRRQKRHIVDPGLTASAVLIPIYCRDGEYHILFTKRSETVKNHKGQISFPGGAYEDGDGSLLNTALRESAEEIGLRASDVEVLGELDDTVTTVSSYIVSPFVVVIPWPYQFKVDEREIERIIEVPISALLDKSCLREETSVEDGEAVSQYFYHYRGDVIWGATARILTQFLDILRGVVGDTGLEHRSE